MTESHPISCGPSTDIQGAAPRVSGSWGALVPLIVLDFGTRVAAPTAVLAFARAEQQVAIWSSALVAGLAAVRALAYGRVQEQFIREFWSSLIHATRSRSIAALRQRTDQHGPIALVESVAVVAHAWAGSIPRLLADGAAVAAVLVATVSLLGASWLAVGLVAAAVGGGIVVLAQRSMRRADDAAFAHYARAAHDYQVLADAATELRAHECEERFARQLAAQVRDMASGQRKVATYSALAGFFPLGVVLLVALAPFGVDVSRVVESLGGGVLEAGVLATTGLFFGYGFARSVEAWSRTAPHRDALATFLSSAPSGPTTGASSVDWRTATVACDDVSVVYPGSRRATPHEVNLVWKPGQGLSLVGANGAGKSTLAHCFIGLTEPTAGMVTFDGVRWADVDWPQARRRIVYVPQDGFVADDRSVEWHLRLTADETTTRDEIVAAAKRVGLWDLLTRRESGPSPLDVAASQLSGGERKRLQLARTLLGDPELVVLDEPEAGLDDAARSWLCGFLGELTRTTRVLVIAHDPAVIPDGFVKISCHASEVASAASSSTEIAQRRCR